MKYVALLSGGKDSCFNLLHCQRNGHELVAAASLGPEPGKDELDSYMYQTVGQDAIELVARALDVPLYRRIISGDAINQGPEYGGRSAQESGGVEGDETEDLYELLVDVLKHHPEIKGVSVGAILSNYQRVRVDHVCRRLELVPLCYLWQRNQAQLLSEMIEAGLTAVLVKVAGIGLTAKHLGNSLAEMEPTLVKLNSLYGSHICGEGGEYETLTVDCPLFKSKIVLEEVEMVIHSDNDFATVAYLRVKRGTLAPKLGPADFQLRVPELLEKPFQQLEDGITASSITSTETDIHYGPENIPPVTDSRSRKVGNWVAVSNIQRSLVANRDPPELSVEEEVSECFHKLEDELRTWGCSLVHCVNINIFLVSMDLFLDVNKVYAQFFGSSPPARACVAVRLPSPIRVRLDVTAYAEQNASDRQALHVQGLSYWAPANIGPYSQAILASEQLFVSGQIGLVPPSLSLATTLSLQTALCHQHVARVVKAVSETSGGWDGIPQLAIHWLAKPYEPANAFLKFETLDSQVPIPSLSLVVDSLPKGASIEKQVLFHTGRWKHHDEDGDLVTETDPPTYTTSEIKCSQGGFISVERLRNVDSSFVLVVCVKGDISGQESVILSEIQSRPILSARAIHAPSATSLQAHLLLEKQIAIPISHILCQRISTKAESDWDYALVFFSP